MCLQIPLKVINIEEDRVLVENGKKLLYKTKGNIAPGDYVYAFGNIVVSKLSKRKAKIIRSALKNE